MIIGIGIDILDLKRFRKIVENNPKILERILTEREIGLFKNFSDPITHYGGRFSLKESIIKACKENLKIKSFKDIEILNDSNGKPVVTKPNINIHISISHEKDFVVTLAIYEI